MEQDSRQRFLTALSVKQPDRIPIWENNIDEASIIKLYELMSGEATGVQERNFGWDRGKEVLELYCRIVEEFEFDATSSMYTVGLKEIGPGLVKDKYGVTFKLSEHSEAVVAEAAIQEPADLRGYEMVSQLNVEEDCRGTLFLLDRLGTSKSHVFDILDPFKVSWYLRGGMENLLIDYYINPAFVHDLARVSTDHILATVDIASKLKVDAVAMIGDIAGNDVPLMSPDHYREFIKPYQKEIVTYAHSRGLKVIKHSDGNLDQIMADIVDVGFDGLHPIQPQCMDIAQVKACYGNRICLLGNIDCEQLLCTGAEAEVEKQVLETMRICRPGGGYIVCSSNSIHAGVSPANYRVMLRTARAHAAYKEE